MQPDEPKIRLLQSRVTDALASAIGERLVGVGYRCLQQEMDEVRFHQPIVSIGGEAVLQFEGRQLMVSWEENAGWSDSFSLYVGEESRLRPDGKFEWWDACELGI